MKDGEQHRGYRQVSNQPEKRAFLSLRSDLALSKRILKIRHFLLTLCFNLGSVLTVQDRILKIRVLASLGKKPLTRVSKRVPGIHGKWGLERGGFVTPLSKSTTWNGNCKRSLGSWRGCLLSTTDTGEGKVDTEHSF